METSHNLKDKTTEAVLLIETSTELCSVAIAENGIVTAYRESSTPKSHASMTAVFIDEVLKERGLTAKSLSGVCVSEGPGSYTGLRVGVSTAKGLCFGARLPLLSVGTLEVLVSQATAEMSAGHFGALSGGNGCNAAEEESSAADESSAEIKSAAADREESVAGGIFRIVPMIDARRMEVYTAVFSGDGKRLTDTEAKVIDENSFADILGQGKVLFIGDAAEKCSGVIRHPNARFLSTFPKASAMAGLAETELKEKRFKDVAYFEPFYLKEFVATVSKKRLF